MITTTTTANTTASVTPAATPDVDLHSAISGALQRIPPLWPLEHFVAVNPFLGFSGQPFADACGTLRKALGHAPVQSPSEYLSAMQTGKITTADLAPFSDDEWSVARLIEKLEAAETSPLFHPLSTFAEILDQTLPHGHWARFVTEEISKWCAVHFDRNQTIWNSPWRHMRLFAAWKSSASLDRKPEAFGLPGFRAFVRSLADDPEVVIHECFRRLAPATDDPTDFLHRQLASISGWAGHLQYLVREDSMRGKENPALLELLAIRLAYDAALHEVFHGDPQVAAAWRHHQAGGGAIDLDHALARWQSAYEMGYQRQLVAQLRGQPSAPIHERPPVQAVFCIDVRSEIVRRHLEAALPGARTLGFAGFFGFPVAHQHAHACKPTSRCPVLLVPPVPSREVAPSDAARNRAEKGAWKAFQNSAASSFTFIESLGLAFAAKLIKRHENRHGDAPPRPEMGTLPVEERARLAEGALRGMSLTGNFARLVLLCGHGSHSANNPYASSLDCGACGGHAGDVNARLAADTLNDPEVREQLAKQGIHIPGDTVFLAGKHDTLADGFVIYEQDRIPASHREEVGRLEAALSKAGEAARRERADRLGLGNLQDATLDKAIQSRGTDIAQVRPEWALANNAAFIAAPRSRTAGLKLDGRVFLHEYQPAEDPESNILTAILTAPVVVASWINLQYYGSRINPETLASGDKTIHQVMAGIGVIEGNAGDLRTGLPLQSIHNGETFLHEPRRLTVVIESATKLIDAVLDAQPAVRQLIDHQWIHLICLTGTTASLRKDGGWVDVPASEA